MTDAEIDSLAKEILIDAISKLKATDERAFLSVRKITSGELIPTYSGTSPEGYGSFICEYMPLDPIKKLLTDCEAIFDDVTSVEAEAIALTTAHQLLKANSSGGRISPNCGL